MQRKQNEFKKIFIFISNMFRLALEKLAQRMHLLGKSIRIM